MKEEWTGIRGVLLALVALGMLGIAAELLLLEHYEEFQQWIPFVVLGAGLVSAGVAWMRPRPGPLRGVQVLMAAFVATGALGVYLHYRGNVEFELEMDASLGGVPLVWEALRGATPALAPSALVYLGLLGLLATWQHPGFRRRDG